MKNERVRTWAECWSLRRSAILNAIVKLIILFPLALIVSTQLALGISCLSGKKNLCLWLPAVMTSVPLSFYLLVCFGLFILSCQVVFYSWQQYVKGKFDHLLPPHRDESA